MRRLRSGYSIAFIATLAAGIAVTCAAVAISKRAFLDPLPYPESHRLLTVQTIIDGRDTIVSSFLFGEALKDSPLFTGVSADFGRTATYEAPGASERLTGSAVTPDYFSVLGVGPALGRTLMAGANDEVVLSWPLFERLLAGRAEAIGTSISLDGMPHRVVGVMPPQFVAPFLTEAEFWTQLNTQPMRAEAARGTGGVVLHARLAPGRTLAEAQAFLDAFGQQQRAAYPAAFAQRRWTINTLQSVLIEPSRTLLMTIAAATGLLVLIVLANIAGLAGIQAVEMRRGAAVRLALGASRARLFAERLRETFALSIIATSAGLWLGWIATAWVVRYQLQFQLLMEDVPAPVFDAAVAASGVTLGVVAAFVAALVPQWAGANMAADELAGSARGPGSQRLAHLRASLVVMQVAVAVVLLVAAGLLIRTVNSLASTPLGFDTAQLSSFTVQPPRARYDTPARVYQLEREVLDGLGRLPAITGATVSLGVPIAYFPSQVGVSAPARAGEPVTGASFTVAPGFFEFLRIPVVDGREFSAADHDQAPLVAIVNETMARMLWPDGRAVGSTVRRTRGATPPVDLTVVGVVPDLRQSGPANDIEPTLYEVTSQRGTLSRVFTIRSAQPTAALLNDIRSVVHGVDPLLAVPALQPLDSRLESQLVQRHFAMSLLTAFGLVAAGLCTLGLFAVVSLTAHARRHEFAMRMALGARSQQVSWLVLRQSVLIAGLGAVLGLAGAFWLTRALSALLFSVRQADPSTYLAAALAILILAVTASMYPALRTARLNPVSVLRAD